MSSGNVEHCIFNPLTPGTFCKKCVFWTCWWFLGWISAKLPLIRSKMRLQYNSLPVWPPASRFSALWLGHAQKSKFWDRFWARKWPMPLAFSIFGIFFALPFSPFLLFLLQWLTFYWAFLWSKNFWESIIETGNGASRCSGRKFCSKFFSQLFEHFCAYTCI